MKLAKQLSEYEIKDECVQHNLIHEKINYTAKNYFFLVNNYSKQITKIENEINSLYPNTPIKLNELIYNQHSIIKELISIINKKQKENSKIKHIKQKSNEIEIDNNKENHIISFNILSSSSKNKNNKQIMEPSHIYKRKIMGISNHPNTINTKKTKNELSRSYNKKISSYVQDISLKNYKNYKNKYMSFLSMTEKIKNEKPKNIFINIKKLNEGKNLYLNSSIENLKSKLKYKYYKPSFLNSFISETKKKNNKKEISKTIDLLSTDLFSYEVRKNKNNKNVSNFDGNNCCYIKKSGKTRSSYAEKDNKKNYNINNLSIIDDRAVNNFIIDRTNSKSRPKMNKYIKNLYLISNEIIDKYQNKIC